MDGFIRKKDILLINADIWDALPIEIQVWLQEAADESSVYQRELWRIETERSLAEVQERGVEVFYPDIAPFVERVQPLIERYEGTRLGELVQKIRDIE